MKVDPQELLAKLQSEPAPLSLAKLKKAYVNKKTGMSEADLREALGAQNIFAWPKNSYWHIDPEDQLRTEILSLCAKRALKTSEIKVKGRTVKNVGATIEKLLADKKLLKYPALTGSGVLLVSADAPKAYWVYVETFVADKLKKAGIEETVFEEQLWQQLIKLEPDKDVPVSAARLRKTLTVDKQRFDEAALKLREQRRIHLSQHDDVHGLSANDREALIDGKDGRYYVAITRRDQ